MLNSHWNHQKISIYCAHLTVTETVFQMDLYFQQKKKLQLSHSKSMGTLQLYKFCAFFTSWTQVNGEDCSINKQAEIRAPLLESNNEKLGWWCWFTKVILTTTDKTCNYFQSLPSELHFPWQVGQAAVYFRHYKIISKVGGTCGKLHLIQRGQTESGSILSILEGVGV